MGIVRVSLRDIPPEVRLSAVPMAARGYAGDPADLIHAAVAPSDMSYLVDARAYELAMDEWRRRGITG